MLSATVRGVQVQRFAGRPGLMDAYWSGFYYMSFAQGVRRRALVGSVLGTLLHHAPSYLLLNILCLAVICVVLTIFTVSLVKVARVSSRQQVGFLVTLLAGFLVTTAWEVFGDLLQIDLLLFFLSTFAIIAIPSGTVRLITGACVLALAFFVHEGSLFVLAPFLPYLHKRRPGLFDYGVSTLLVVLFVSLAFFWSKPAVSVPARPHVTASAEAPPPLPVMLHREIGHDFGSVRLQAAFASRVLRTLLILSALLITVAQTLPPPTFNEFGHIFERSLLFSLPLWMIAHDWGRFVAYLSMLTFFVTWINDRRDPDRVTKIVPVPICVRFVSRYAGIEAVQIAAAAVLLLAPGFEARVSGMSLRGFFASLPFVLFAISKVIKALPVGSLSS